jgi:alpha-amylase
MLNGFVKTFSGSSPSPMSTLAGYIDKANAYPDQSLVGAFLDNQDLARFNALVNDKTKVHNAIVGTFLYAGIPAIYYGLEQDIADGTDDPANRNALWLYNGFSTETETYKRIAKLNQIRHAWNKDNDWLRAHATVVDVATSDIALKRGNLLIVLTNVSTKLSIINNTYADQYQRGSGATGTWTAAKGSFEAGSTVYE